MRKSILTVCMCFVCLLSNAQVEKNVVYDCVTEEIGYTQPVEQKKSGGQKTAEILGAVLSAAAGSSTVTEQHPEYEGAVRDAIIGAIGRARRLRVIEGERPETGIYIEGNISAISTTRRVHVWTSNDKKTHEDIEYRGNITATINLRDVKDGGIVTTISINSSSWVDYWVATSDKALGYAINYMKESITNRLNLSFPLYASIVESATAKKDKQKEVYIDLGAPAGVYKGLTFYVYAVTEVAGREAKKEIGRLKVTEVMGDEISLCKVTRGGSDIKKAIDAGTTLQITSRE